jgi:hypothetical protein
MDPLDDLTQRLRQAITTGTSITETVVMGVASAVRRDWAGERVYVRRPSLDLEGLRREFAAGAPSGELARRYGVTERWVRKRGRGG